MQEATARTLGYDVRLLARLSDDDRERVRWLAAGWLWCCALLAAPIGYLAWLGTHRAPFALLIGCGLFALLLIVLRLSVAGGGLRLEHDARTHEPSGGPALLIAALALMFAQPAQLPLLRAEQAAPVAAQRRALLARHHASAVEIATPSDARATSGFVDEITRCEFIALRLQDVWRDPVRALRYTLLYGVLVLLPAFWARTFALGALRRYDLLRAQQQRRTVARSTRRTDGAIAALLAPYPTYEASDAQASSSGARR